LQQPKEIPKTTDVASELPSARGTLLPMYSISDRSTMSQPLSKYDQPIRIDQLLKPDVNITTTTTTTAISPDTSPGQRGTLLPKFDPGEKAASFEMPKPSRPPPSLPGGSHSANSILVPSKVDSKPIGNSPTTSPGMQRASTPVSLNGQKIGANFCSECGSKLDNNGACPLNCQRMKIRGTIAPKEDLCDSCGKPLSLEPFTNAGGKLWHKSCFVCAGCGRAFVDTFALKDGKPYHAECARPKCAKCGESCSGKTVLADSKKYHDFCFTCQNCGKSLAGLPYVSKDEEVWCRQCAIVNVTDDDTF